jgi:hypothetical protein
VTSHADTEFNVVLGVVVWPGCAGVVAGMLVAVKQQLPDADIQLRGLKIKCRHLPFLHLAVMLAAAAATHQYLAGCLLRSFSGYLKWRSPILEK